jgi:transcriptional regulator with XRE-family HTH domain
MDALASTLTATIGERIRGARTARRWTLDQLADAAGISRRQLVNVEQGEANPSIGTLLAVSEALGISLADLVAPPSATLVTITRAGEGAELWTGRHGGRGVLLASTRPPDVVELWEWRLQSRDRHDSEAHHKGTRELVHVHSGVLTLEVADDRFELSAGDAMTFPGDVNHAYANESAPPVHFSLSVLDPRPASSPERKATDA